MHFERINLVQQFLYLPSDEVHGRLLKSNLEIKLVHRGFMHLKHLCSFSSGVSSPWLSREEAVLKAKSERLGEALMSIIGLILASWTHVVRSKLQ